MIVGPYAYAYVLLPIEDWESTILVELYAKAGAASPHIIRGAARSASVMAAMWRR